jgi:PAS domain S-box-containing protein
MEILRRLRLPTASLHIKLTVTLAILVVVVTAGSVTFLIERERGERLGRLEERATRIADLLEQSLAQELWNVDSKAIQRQLNALAPIPELAEVTVTAVGHGTVASAGPRNMSDAKGGIVRVRPITYAHVEGLPPQTIGEVTVILTRAEAEAAIARARWAILAMAAAVVLTLYAGTSVLLNRLLRSPITRLEAMVDRLAAGDLDARCSVDSADELGRLAERVNLMADRLRGSTVHLRESETRFRTFVDHAADAFFMLDFERGTIVDVNRCACESFGYTREELIGKHPLDLDVGLYEASLAQLLERVGAGETATFESLYRRKDGTVFPVEIRGRQFQEGELRFCLSLVRDITERKRAEAELRASEERFRTLVEFSFDVYWETDAQHRFTRQELGGALADAPASGSEIGKTRWEVPYLEPDEEAWRKHRATLDSHLPFRDFELARPTPDGNKRYVSVSGLPVFDSTGRFLGYRGVGRLITDRKRTEQALRDSETRLRTFLDHAADAFFMLEFDQGTILDVNRCACESLGYARDELIGMTPLAFDMDLDRATLESIAGRAAGGGTVLFKRHRHRRKDGSVFPVEVQTSVFWHDGRRFLLKVARNISDRVQAEQEHERLRQLQADLAHLQRVSLMGELAASIAHEVNQPLSGVVSNGSACLRWLAGDVPNLDEAREAARRIVRDGKRAGEVIARVRAMTRPAATPTDTLDLNQTIQEVLALVGDEAETKSAILRTQFADDLAPVAGDRVQLQQVVLNLVMNAIEAMSSVSGRAREVIITTRDVDAHDVQVTVEDSGTGLDPDRMQKIFDPFYTTKASGMGMGLSICRSIVQSHGGRLWATAKDGPGTIFHLALPKYRGEERHAGVEDV